MKVREANLYLEKVGEAEIQNFFNTVVKAKLPLFGFLDFSDMLALNAIQMIVRRQNNTIKFYMKEKPHLRNLSALVFPFRLSEVSDLEPRKGSFFPVPRLFMIDGSRYDLLDFMLKGSIEELVLNVTKFLGGYVVTGSATDEKGRKGIVTVTNPQKFFKIDLEKSSSIYIEVLEPIPKKMAMTSQYPIFEETGITLGVDNFDPFQHTIIAGTSGSGKSKALYVMLKAIEAKYKDNVRIIIIDPHGEFIPMFPHVKIVNFIDNYIEPLDVGEQKSPMLTQLVSQLIASSIGQENKYSERVLFYTVHLLTSLDKLELNNISALLTDPSVKAEYVSKTSNEEVKRFFDEEYNDIYIHHFNDAILPILNFIGEYQLYLGKNRVRENLMQLLTNNRITVVSFNPHFFGRRMISFLSSAVINQMYILAITSKLMDKPTILVVDEFPRVETRVTRDILSETRKFNLYAYLSCQYLGQLSKEVLDSIVSNARNIISFKITRQDATMLSSIMEIKVEEYFKKGRAQQELEESKKEMFVRLHQRECIVRLFDGKKYLLPMKLRIVDARKWGLDENAIKTAFKEQGDAGGREEGEMPITNPGPPPLQKETEAEMQEKMRELARQAIAKMSPEQNETYMPQKEEKKFGFQQIVAVPPVEKKEEKEAEEKPAEEEPKEERQLPKPIHEEKHEEAAPPRRTFMERQVEIVRSKKTAEETPVVQEKEPKMPVVQETEETEPEAEPEEEKPKAAPKAKSKTKSKPAPLAKKKKR